MYIYGRNVVGYQVAKDLMPLSFEVFSCLCRTLNVHVLGRWGVEHKHPIRLAMLEVERVRELCC